MAIPDACLALDYDGAGGFAGGAGPGGASGTDGVEAVAPGGAVASTYNSGPAEGPLSSYNPGYGAVSASWPYIMLVQGMRRDIYIQLKDSVSGGPESDLTDVHSVKLVAKEWMNAPETYLTKDCVVVSAAEGLLKIRFKPSNLTLAGIWPAAVICYNSADELIAQYRAYLYVQPSLTDIGTGVSTTYPLQPHEIRMEMRDACPAANSLLEDVEFSDLEIFYNIQKPIEEWNETPPDLSDAGASYTQNTFPWRHAWRRATVGYLLRTAAIWQERNNFNYSAGGLSVKDKDKGQPYMAISERLIGEWRDWVMHKKAEINQGLCYGSMNSAAFLGNGY